MSEKVRVRYAPSPTGELHIGNARTALFNYLFARHYGGDFIIRIEDTDVARNVEHGEASQLRNLEWLGIDWDESPDKPGEYGPYRQSERLDIYQKYIDQLLAEDKAYRCYMTAEELEAEREGQRARGEMPRYAGQHAHLTPEEEQAFIDEGRKPSVRLRVDPEAVYEFDDMVKGKVSFVAEHITGDWVIQKADGYPTYNFAVVIDDHLMDITHVIRGEDHIANTPRQMMVYDALGWECPEFGHASLIHNAETGKVLSKRDGDILQFIEQYRELGYLPEAIFNFLALLGWSPGGEREIYSREELIEIFDEHRISKAPAAFDQKKLTWINNRYVKEAELDEVVELSLPHLIKAGRVSENPDAEEMDWVKKLVSLYQAEMSCGAEIVELTDAYFEDEVNLSDELIDTISTEDAQKAIHAFKEKIEDLDEADFTSENISPLFKEVQKETGVKGRGLWMPLRIATTGHEHGPELPLMLEVLGKEKIVDHIEQVLELI